MSRGALSAINTRHTAQTEQADPRQIPNHAGGYGFQISDEDRLRRFLVLGTEGGTYYQSEQALTKENAKLVIDFAANDPVRLVEILVDFSVNNRAPKQNTILFSLAVAASSPVEAGRKAAFDALPKIARTGTHLMIFAGYIQQFRGWGTGLKKAGQRWYNDKDVDKLAYQMVKYRSREGISQRDLLRILHPKTQDASRNALYRWVVSGDVNEEVPSIVNNFLSAQNASKASSWGDLINSDSGLSWEMLPDAALKERDVWAALLDKGMPTGALIRQLPRLTNLGLISGSLAKGDKTAKIVEQLTSSEALTKARIHPYNVLLALYTYNSGHSFKGSTSWTPVQAVVDALDQAFYASFGNVEPANKRTMLALDISGSMGWDKIANSPITPREGSAAMALITAATEPVYDIFAFDTYFSPAGISPKMRLDQVIDNLSDMRMAGTDCSLPMIKALELGLEVDTFVVYTDSETYAGKKMHPMQALRNYRNQTGIPAKLVVVGMTATDVSVADPKDAGSLDIVGFDSSAPSLISSFSRGDF